MLNNIDWLLLTFYFNNNNEIKGKKRLQKIVCILKNKYDIDFTYDFIPYYYGPYSDSLSDTLDILIESELIKEDVISLTDQKHLYKYKLTSKGLNLVEKIMEVHDTQNLISAINDIKDEPTPVLVRLSKEVSHLY